MGGRCCCVVGCTNYTRKTHGVCYHNFPSDSALREKWISAIGRDGWLPSKWACVCSDHFSPESYEDSVHLMEAFGLSKPHFYRRLKADAVPTVFKELSRLPQARGKTIKRKAEGRPTYCNTCKKSTRNAQTATIPPLKGGVDVAVGTKRRADCKLCKSTQASFGPLMVDWWTDTADLENLQDASADRREQPVPFVHGSSGLHERKQSPGVSAVHDSQLDGQEGPASGSSDLSLDSAYFVSTGPEGDSGRRAEVAVDRTILPRNVSKPVTIEVSANPLYTCAFCLTAFGHLRDLAGHVEACPWPEPYLCGLCSEPCKDWKTTRAHMSAHVGKRLACPFCQRKIYKLKYDLVHRHIMLHVTVRQFMCSLCRSAFPSKEGLRSHHSMSRSKGLSCRHTKRRPRKGNASCPRPTVSTHR
ncbi:zinc finger protein 236 isoform X4 [Rhipicephalus sanguineus]|uniref:zinc finger protein 236 isoform X4 n=1 Tax=Rhipicephalus sanguineus TaxID=34632 RepID=UPI0018952F51|nr:zinc finger protein 236 isoform X4 [Rhipicephalus sanguineus]